MHKKILSCWHKLEYFSPASTPKINNKDVLLLENDTIEPWQNPTETELQDPKKTIEYTIYLGVFDYSIAEEFIKDYFTYKKNNENFQNSKTCFASLKLDSQGIYIANTFGISTLPWALGQLKNNNIKNDQWQGEFNSLKKDLIEYIELNFQEASFSIDGENRTSAMVTKSQLLALQHRIEDLCNWSGEFEKQIYVKKTQKTVTSNQSKGNAEILNSFYIEDLEKIISNYDYSKKSPPKAFEQYLNGCLDLQSTSNRLDVSKNVEKLKENLSPDNYPDGCWPSDYTLSLMQQFAVNNIFNNLSKSDQKGIFSVNGPPGTGKTTLLRDIIAPIIVKRAKKLSAITKPAEAFKKIGILESDKFSAIYQPCKSITNGGIVIASSNNGAVENISKELPLIQEVSKTYSSEISYFKTVAKECIDKDYWGIISAVLGNKQNRKLLETNLWFKEGNNLQKTLKNDKLCDDNEWNSIKEKFSEKLAEILEEKKCLSTFKTECETFDRLQYTILVEIAKDLDQAENKFLTLKSQYKQLEIKLINLEKDKEKLLNEFNIIRITKPSFFSYWFNKAKRNLYKKALESSLNKYNQISDALKIESLNLAKIEAEVNKLQTSIANKKADKAILDQQAKSLNIKTNKAKAELKNNYADAKFWTNIETKETQESCPWYSDKLKKLQSELFIIALKLNEIFILRANASSNRILKTLVAFFNYLNGKYTASREEVKAMWDTFFLVIPVVSSAFASIQTMFKDLNEEDIPWLFIDEAGQAVPQAAAGSIWRAKRVAVVGDPFQIEPVVTIADSITNNIGNYFDLKTNSINSELSVQSMTDRINPLGYYLNTNNKNEWIGIPLRVHRRCINPMFEIANKIAYDNTMYCSTANPKNIKVSFNTSFIDCKGKVEGKHFVKKQAEKVKEILIKEVNFSKNLPDVFIITPFSEISNLLKNFLIEALVFEANKYEIEKSKVHNWLKSHIGTVHTFQGKQAEGVIFCLGLDETKKGAADWASSKPNLLNVAITRAKFRFIAIGDEDIWIGKDNFKRAYFSELSALNS